MNQCFIISPPRAGSTLLQRLLSAHSRIATVGEPWLALPFAYALREDGVRSEYSHRSQTAGINEFLSTIPGGRQAWFAEAGQMLARLQSSLATDKTWFLDKTPRYYLILDELVAMFPDARFIVLHRNPLAVVASILTTWHDARFRFGSSEIDIYESPRKIAAFVRQSNPQVTTLHYEDLVTAPETSLRQITDFLSLDPLDSVSLPDDDPLKRSALGDKTGTNRFSNVTAASVDAWKAQFASPIRKAWARRYLDWLGAETLSTLGYDHDRLLAEINDIPASLPQAAIDLFDLNTRVFPLWFAPRMEFVRDRRRDARATFRWAPRF